MSMIENNVCQKSEKFVEHNKKLFRENQYATLANEYKPHGKAVKVLIGTFKHSITFLCANFNF